MSDCTHEFIEDWQDYCPDCGLPAIEVAEARELIRLREENARMKVALQRVQKHRDELISGQRSAANATLRKKVRDDRRYIEKQRRELAMLYARCRVAIDALLLVQRVFDEALPRFNWGASALDGNAIDILNRGPIAVHAALRELRNER